MYICTPKNTECRVGQSVKTPPFHGGMTSSTLVRGTKNQSENECGERKLLNEFSLCFFYIALALFLTLSNFLYFKRFQSS